MEVNKEDLPGRKVLKNCKLPGEWWLEDAIAGSLEGTAAASADSAFLEIACCGAGCDARGEGRGPCTPGRWRLLLTHVTQQHAWIKELNTSRGLGWVKKWGLDSDHHFSQVTDQMFSSQVKALSAGIYIACEESLCLVTILVVMATE